MRNTKRLAAGFLGLCLAVSMAGPASAGAVTVYDSYGDPYTIGSDEFKVKFNGEAVAFPDAQPFVDGNGRTLVPVRFVAETMGAEVGWDKTTQTATIEKDGTTLAITIGQQSMSVTKDGTGDTVQMDTAAVFKDGRTYVPIRFVAEALGAWVGYSDLFTTVQIYQDVLTPEEITRLHGYYDLSYEEWLKSRGSWDANDPEDTDEDWAKRYPQVNYYTGTNGFSNANEWKLCNPNNHEIRDKGINKKPTTYFGAVSGLTFTFGTQPDVDFAKLCLAEARDGLAAELGEKLNMTVTVRTDLSCVFASRNSNDAFASVRAIISVSVPKDAKSADIEWVKEYLCLDSVKAGETYEADIQIEVLTFDADVHWRSFSTLLVGE